MTSSKSHTQFTISVTKNRKPRTKVKTLLKEEADQLADRLLDLLHDQMIMSIRDPDLFISVIVGAAQDLRKVK